jgi:hypothetical protein
VKSPSVSTSALPPDSERSRTRNRRLEEIFEAALVRHGRPLPPTPDAVGELLMVLKAPS